MSSVQRSIPDSDSGVTPVDPDPHRFRTGRLVLVVEGVVLAVLGGWGMVADLTAGRAGPAGVPVLFFHVTITQSVLLLATGLLAAIAARRRRTALILAGAQFIGYLLLFTAGSVAYAREVSTPLGLDIADLVGYLVLAALGVALFMWLSGQDLEGRWWIRNRAGRAAGRPAPAQPPTRDPADRRARPEPAPEPARPGTEDYDRFGPGLQDDSNLYRTKLIAGGSSVVALVAMFFTSLSRAPAQAWSAVLPALAAVLLVAIGARVVRERRARHPR